MSKRKKHIPDDVKVFEPHFNDEEYEKKLRVVEALEARNDRIEDNLRKWYKVTKHLCELLDELEKDGKLTEVQRDRFHRHAKTMGFKTGKNASFDVDTILKSSLSVTENENGSYRINLDDDKVSPYAYLASVWQDNSKVNRYMREELNGAIDSFHKTVDEVVESREQEQSIDCKAVDDFYDKYSDEFVNQLVNDIMNSSLKDPWLDIEQYGAISDTNIEALLIGYAAGIMFGNKNQGEK